MGILVNPLVCYNVQR